MGDDGAPQTFAQAGTTSNTWSVSQFDCSPLLDRTTVHAMKEAVLANRKVSAENRTPVNKHVAS